MPMPSLVSSVSGAHAKLKTVPATDALCLDIRLVADVGVDSERGKGHFVRGTPPLQSRFRLFAWSQGVTPVTSSMHSNHPLTMSLYTGPAAYCRQPRKGVTLRFAAVTTASNPFFARHREWFPKQTKDLKTMATIVTLTQKNDGFEGTLATLTVTAPIALVPNTRKAKDNEPDYRIVNRKNGFELGAGWNRTSKASGEPYISISISAPKFGTIYGNVATAPGDDPAKKVIIWNPAN